MNTIDGRLIFNYNQHVLVDERTDAVGKLIGYSPNKSIFYVHVHNKILKLVHVKSTNDRTSTNNQITRLTIAESYDYLNGFLNNKSITKPKTSDRISSANNSMSKIKSTIKIVEKLKQPIWFSDNKPNKKTEVKDDFDELDESNDIVNKMIQQDQAIFSANINLKIGVVYFVYTDKWAMGIYFSAYLNKKNISHNPICLELYKLEISTIILKMDSYSILNFLSVFI